MGLPQENVKGYRRHNCTYLWIFRRGSTIRPLWATSSTV